MSGYLLDTYPAGATVRCFFPSYDSNGASVTLSGLAVSDIEIYKDGSATQRSSDAGYSLLDTDGIDFDGITGVNGFAINLGDNTDSGFFAVGSQYAVVVSAVTIDSQTVNIVCGQFRIVAAESSAGVPKADVSHFGGSAGSFAAGIPAVNAAQVSGDAAAADSLEAALDGTGGVTLTAAISGNITGNLSGSVGSLASQAKADVNAEVVDALATDSHGEPGAGAPAASASLRDKIGYLYKAWRNRTQQTETEYRLFADDGSTVHQEADVSDDATTFTRGEMRAPD